MTHPDSRLDSWLPNTEHDRELVLDALEKVAQSSTFSTSRRYPAMLRYIVKKSLDGHPDQLKERTIGIEVFGRNADYDTHEDPVVRMSAGEIRKRLAQFYRDHPNESEFEFRLPLGSYVPLIHINRPASIEEKSSGVDEPGAALPFVGTPHPESKKQQHLPLYWTLAVIAVLLAAAVGGWLITHRPPPATSLLDQVWSPLIDNPNPVLMSLGRPISRGKEEAEPANISIQDHIIRPEFRVSLTTAQAIANVAGYLQLHKKEFRIHDAASNSLSDFHQRPTVLVNANDNKWTLLLMKPLRYQFATLPGKTVSYIHDSEKPDMHDWAVDFLQPFHQQTVDYAIVSRFISPTTQAPVIVIAGISSNGTEAAGEFIVEPNKMAELLSRAPANWNGNNFEAVLKVEVVDGNNGDSTIVASEFW